MVKKSDIPRDLIDVKSFKDRMHTLQRQHDDIVKESDKLADEYYNRLKVVRERLGQEFIKNMDGCKHQDRINEKDPPQVHFDWCRICSERIWNGHHWLSDWLKSPNWLDRNQMRKLDDYLNDINSVYSISFYVCADDYD